MVTSEVVTSGDRQRKEEPAAGCPSWEFTVGLVRGILIGPGIVLHGCPGGGGGDRQTGCMLVKREGMRGGRMEGDRQTGCMLVKREGVEVEGDRQTGCVLVKREGMLAGGAGGKQGGTFMSGSATVACCRLGVLSLDIPESTGLRSLSHRGSASHVALATGTVEMKGFHYQMCSLPPSFCGVKFL